MTADKDVFTFEDVLLAERDLAARLPLPMELPVSMVTPMQVRMARMVSRLLRHRERYVKAWIAATGLHPEECILEEKQFVGPDGQWGVQVSVRRRDRA